jgi:hypothetical protein
MSQKRRREPRFVRARSFRGIITSHCLDVSADHDRTVCPTGSPLAQSSPRLRSRSDKLNGVSATVRHGISQSAGGTATRKANARLRSSSRYYRNIIAILSQSGGPMGLHVTLAYCVFGDVFRFDVLTRYGGFGLFALANCVFSGRHRGSGRSYYLERMVSVRRESRPGNCQREQGGQESNFRCFHGISFFWGERIHLRVFGQINKRQSRIIPEMNPASRGKHALRVRAPSSHATVRCAPREANWNGAPVSNWAAAERARI